MNKRTAMSALLVAAAVVVGSTVTVTEASASTGCSDGSGYRNCRKDNPYGYGWVSVTAYPGKVKAAQDGGKDVWIDSNNANHWAAGGTYAETTGSAHLRWRACTWFHNQFNDPYVDCTPWVQGY
jgi:hypothetical protein